MSTPAPDNTVADLDSYEAPEATPKVADRVTTAAAADVDVLPASGGDEVSNAKPDEPSKLQPAPMYRLFALASPVEFVILAAGVFGCVLHGISMPLLCVIFGQMIDAAGYDAQATMEAMQDEVANICWAGVIAQIGATLQGSCFGIFADRQARRMRVMYLDSVLHQDVEWYDIRNVAAIPTSMADDMQKIAEALGDKLGAFCMGGFSFLACCFCAAYFGWHVGLVSCIMLPPMILSTIAVGSMMQAIQYEQQGWYEKAAATVEDCLFAFRTVVAFGGEFRELETYSKSVHQAKLGGVRNSFRQGMGLGVFYGVMTLSFALSLYYGMTRIYEGTNNPTRDRPYSGGDIIGVFFCIWTAGFLVGNMDPGVKAMRQGKMSAARFLSVLDSKPQIQMRTNEDTRQPLESIEQLELKDVHFSYPTRPGVPILKGISLEIPKGWKVALVGESGCGKSTVMSLLERFYDPSSGSVLVNGIDMRKYKISTLRRHIGYVGQEPVLFATSVRKNIMYGYPAASEDDIQRVKSDAQLSFLDVMKDGLDTYVGSGGSQFSGGQKQRIAMARALLKRPTVLYLDEATSALDSNSEKMLQETIDSLGAGPQGMTIVSIAHRLSTIRSSNRIYVLKEGVVAEFGAHAELMSAKGIYYGLVSTQSQALEDPSGSGGGAAADAGAAGAPASELKRDVSGGNGADNPNVVAVEQQAETGDNGKGKKGKKGKKAERTEPLTEEEERDEALKKYKPPMSRLFAYNRPEWPWMIPGVLGAAVFGSWAPVISWLLVNSLRSFYLPREEMRDDVTVLCLIFIGAAIAHLLGSICQEVGFGVLGQSLTMRLRIAILKAAFRQEVGFHDDPKHTSSMLGEALQYWAHRVHLLIYKLAVEVAMGCTLIAGVTIAFIYSWQMALVMLGTIPVLVCAGMVQMIVMMGATEKGGGQSPASKQLVADAVQNGRTVQATGIEQELVTAYTRLAWESARGCPWRFCVAGFAFGLSSSVQFFVIGFGFWYASKLLEDGNAGFEDVMQAFMGITFAGLGAGMAASGMGDVAKAKIACFDMFQLLDRKPLIDGLEPDGVLPAWGSAQPKADGEAHNSEAGDISFQAVHFHYPFRKEVKVLKGLSFTIRRGQSVGLVGPSGGGKSTIMALLQRFYDPVEGGVFIGATDKKPLKELNIRWWRRQVGFVGQEPILFNTTVRANVMYGLEEHEREALPEEKLNRYKAMANLSFIDKAEGWETPVGQRGSRLSGGQKQRVAICRALVRDPPVLLLDEATSALDNQSEKLVQKALDVAKKGRTSFAIAHRLTTVADCDTILVIAEGKVLEQGTRAQLMDLRGVFYKLQLHQGQH